MYIINVRHNQPINSYEFKVVTQYEGIKSMDIFMCLNERTTNANVWQTIHRLCNPVKRLIFICDNN